MRTCVSRGQAAGAVVLRRAARKVVAEMLEERRLFATFTVTNLNMDGAGSLYQAVLDANAQSGADVIEFQAGLSGTITTRDTLRVAESLDVRGPGASVLSVQPFNDPEEGRGQGWVIDGVGDNVVKISGLTITNGGDEHSGGGIANSENLTLDHVIVTKNHSQGGSGGGVANYGGLTVLYSTISDNSAGGSSDDGGGGIYSKAGDLVVRYSTISGNVSDGGTTYGGGIYVEGGNANIENSTVSGNEQFGSGGGIASAGTTNILDSAVVNNKASAGEASPSDSGGGVYVISGTTKIQSSIFGGNTAQKTNSDPYFASDLARADGTLILERSVVQTTPATGVVTELRAGNLLGTDPKIGPLAANGGPTKTHALLIGSPAIDHGFNATNSPTDQRGQPRPEGSGAADTGPFEYPATRNTFNVSADAYVQDGDSKKKNFGTETQLAVKKTSSSGLNRIAYLTFDIHMWDAGDAVGSSTLQTFAQLSKDQSGGVPVTLYAVADTSWSETAITYSNKPALGSALGTKTVSSTTQAEIDWDITKYIQQQVKAGKTKVSFALKGVNNTSALALFGAREVAGAGAYSGLVIQGAESTPTPTPTGALSPTQDTYARNGSFSDDSFGSENELLVKKGSSDGAVREAYLKFDLTTVSSVTSVKLRLFGMVSDDRAASLGVTLYGASNNSWNENGLTYDDRPSAGSSLGSKTITGTTGQWYEWDVTSYVKSAKSAGKSSVTFVIKANASSSPWVAFNSSEAGSNGPQLVAG